MTVETLSTQTAREVTAAKNTNDTDNILREFAKCAVTLREILHQDRSLLFIDNHFQVLQMAYLRWKRKHIASPTD